jgi:transposase-like protein
MVRRYLGSAGHHGLAKEEVAEARPAGSALPLGVADDDPDLQEAYRRYDAATGLSIERTKPQSLATVAGKLRRVVAIVGAPSDHREVIRSGNVWRSLSGKSRSRESE